MSGRNSMMNVTPVGQYSTPPTRRSSYHGDHQVVTTYNEKNDIKEEVASINVEDMTVYDPESATAGPTHRPSKSSPFKAP